MAKATKATIRKVNDLLESVHGKKVNRHHDDPLDELILTILSQHTNDQNRDRAYENLRRHFPTWEDARAARVADIADAIRCGGLANQKAARIQDILNQIQEERGALSLDFLHAASIEEAEEFLSRFNGVGPKTIACVLLFACKKPAFPIDTHIDRITRRLGWVDAKTSTQAAHAFIRPLVPDEIKYQLHVNLIWHGRTTCKAQKPLCEQCALRKLCQWYQA
jgi:endonuclease-3